jgi:putative iron-only hydrogenase system regulator
MAKRIGFVGIIIEDREKCVELVNKILSDFGEIIVARTGIPYKDKNCSVITLVVDATTDEIGAMTGRLGHVTGVSVKAALGKKG